MASLACSGFSRLVSTRLSGKHYIHFLKQDLDLFSKTTRRLFLDARLSCQHSPGDRTRMGQSSNAPSNIGIQSNAFSSLSIPSDPFGLRRLHAGEDRRKVLEQK